MTKYTDVEHNLPSLRVSRAWQEAEKIAEEHGVDRSVALEIAQAVVAIIGEGTWRSGHRCPTCKSKIEWKGTASHSFCPNCGYLGQMAPLALEIAFPPVVYDSAPKESAVKRSKSSPFSSSFGRHRR